MDIAENLTASFLKGKGQLYAMHDMDQAMMLSTMILYGMMRICMMYVNVMF